MSDEPIRDSTIACGDMVADRAECPIDYTAMDGPTMLAACGDNGAKWANAFCQTAKKLGHGDIDEGWMIGWFANAIEQSRAVRATPSPSGDSAEGVLNDIRDALETRGYFHMANGRDIGLLLDGAAIPKPAPDAVRPDAWQWHGSSLTDDDPDWVAEATEPTSSTLSFWVFTGGLTVRTARGNQQAHPLDWIVRIDGEIFLFSESAWNTVSTPAPSPDASAFDDAGNLPVQSGAGERSQLVDLNIKRMNALIETARPENRWEQEAKAEMEKAVAAFNEVN